MRNAVSRIAFALTILALGPVLSSCTSTSAAPGDGASGQPGTASEQNSGNLLYRPVNGGWSGHWTPDRRHAEEHLRDHNARNNLTGGVVEYR